MTDIVNVTGLKCPFQIIEVQKYVREKKDMSKVLIISDKDDGGFFEDLKHFCNKKILKISNIDISECEDKQFFLIEK